MKFFDREDKVANLRAIRDRSVAEAQFTVITGRRRVGKTMLAKHAFGDRPFVYLFVSCKGEPELVEGFVDEVNQVVPGAIAPEVRTLEGFFRELFKTARSHHLTVFIDEFQDFYKVKPSVFSVLQGLWDRNCESMRINLVVCGSVNALMNRIFFNRKEPLYGRQTAVVRLSAFSVEVLKDILGHHRRNYRPEDLLALWTITGGVAKYVALLMDAGATDFQSMAEFILSEDSFFLDEGRVLLSDEFGKDYTTYFSILSAIARGVTSRNEIEQSVGCQIGGHLTRLERDYHLISKRLPFDARTTRQVRYQIDDPFYRFWFRFVFRYDYMVQKGAFRLLKKIVRRDFAAFSGRALEEYFARKLVESGEWSRVGNWWDRKGENEIDLIAENELDGRLLVAEVKRDRKRIDLGQLESKFAAFAKATGRGGRKKPTYRALSLEDM